MAISTWLSSGFRVELTSSPTSPMTESYREQQFTYWYMAETPTHFSTIFWILWTHWERVEWSWAEEEKELAFSPPFHRCHAVERRNVMMGGGVGESSHSQGSPLRPACLGSEEEDVSRFTEDTQQVWVCYAAPGAGHPSGPGVSTCSANSSSTWMPRHP